MSKTEYQFDNIAGMQRNREIEGEKGTELGLPGGITFTVLAASDGTSTVMFGSARMTAMSSVAWCVAPSSASDMPQ